MSIVRVQWERRVGKRKASERSEDARARGEDIRIRTRLVGPWARDDTLDKANVRVGHLLKFLTRHILNSDSKTRSNFPQAQGTMLPLSHLFPVV